MLEAVELTKLYASIRPQDVTELRTGQMPMPGSQWQWKSTDGQNAHGLLEL